MKGINTKFTNLWDAKIEKNMCQRITQDNIYVVRQFAYVHGVVGISLFIRKNYKMQQYSFLSKNLGSTSAFRDSGAGAGTGAGLGNF